MAHPPQTSPEPAPRQLELWLADPGEIGDEGLLRSYRNLLSREESARVQRFHFDKDRHNYLVAHALLRTALSAHAPVAPQDWVFRANAYGRPEIANDAMVRGALSFNISRSAGLVACAVSTAGVIGVDVENIERETSGADIAGRFFSPQEARDLGEVARTDRAERFFHYWTLKEAYIKARGRGLSIPLERFSFAFPGTGGITLAVDPQLDDAGDRWHCWLFRPDARHIAAVCLERDAMPRPELRVRRSVPLAWSEPCPCEMLRSSPAEP